MTDLIPRTVVTEIVSHRDAALDAYGCIFDAIEAAAGSLTKAERHLGLAGCASLPRVSAPEVEAFHATLAALPDVDRLRRVARRLVDLQIWHYVIERTDLRALMDKEAKDEMRKRIAYVPEQVRRSDGAIINRAEIDRAIPPASEENILATIESFAEQAGEIWRRGIANAFSALDSRFKSHDGFKVGARVILTYVFDRDGDWTYRNHEDTLMDIERVFYVLDGRNPPRSREDSIVGQISRERRGVHGPRASEHQSDYFLVRGYRNCNAHLWFTRSDLVEQVNRLLAEHYGATLGYGRETAGESKTRPDPFERAVDRPPARNFGFFPSPPAVVENVTREARLWQDEPLRILEPSAGTGALALAAHDPSEEGYKAPTTHRVDVVEIQADLVAELNRGPYARVTHADFLTLTPRREYDRVVMNPPFDRGRDLDHVHHALGFLKPGGRLVSVMSASARYGTNRKAETFRRRVEAMGAKWSDLPAGSFKDSGPGTNVNTVILTVNLPTEIA